MTYKVIYAHRQGEYTMARTHGQMKKNKNGTITIRSTIPASMADDAIKLQEMGYTPFDWIRIGIRTMRREEGLVNT